MRTLNPLAYLAGIAASQIGHHEDGDSNTGSQIAAYQAATILGMPTPGHGWPWCCAFVDWCIAHFILAHPGVLSCESGPDGRSKRPTTASVVGFLKWASDTGQDVHTNAFTPQAGDIVVMEFPTGHHIGIVSAPGSTPGTCSTVEGNTSRDTKDQGDQRNGGEVAAKPHRGRPEIIAFIRLAVKGTRLS